MNAPNDHATPRGFREWWASPPRTGLRRLINPWEYRHLRFCGGMRIAGGLVGLFAGLVCASYGVWGWAAFFLAIAAANFAGGAWYLNVARSLATPA